MESLCRMAGDILSAEGEASGDGRVRPHPDGRTLRYYTTIGLLDRPYRKGRTGTYGRRHLLQVLAIKRLQAEGASLAEVQSHLVGLTNRELERIAKPPSDLPSTAAAAPVAAESPAEPILRRGFWSVVPEIGEFNTTPHSGRLSALRLADGAVLLLSGNELSAAEQKELEQAAKPLLKILKRNQRIR